MRYFGAVRGTGRFASPRTSSTATSLFPAGHVRRRRASPAPTTTRRVFADPDDVRHHPRAGAGQPQLTFGSGIHYCLGASLARAELQEALPHPGPADARPGRSTATITWKPETVGIWGPLRLPLRFTPS